MKRANIGSGSIRPDSWDNYDIEDWDVRYCLHECELASVEQGRPPAHVSGGCECVGGIYDYALVDHVLMSFDHHEVKRVLFNLLSVLKPGGMLRISEPDIVAGWAAFATNQESFFPQDDHTPGLDAKFCTWMTWYGTRRSVFTPAYLSELLFEAGFSEVKEAAYGLTFGPEPGCMDLDSRQGESFFLEAFK